MEQVTLFSHPLFQQHQTGQHPERPLRLARILSRIEASGLVAQCRRGLFQPATTSQISRAHDPSVAITAAQVAKSGGGMLDADTVVSPESYDVACAAAGAAIAAVDDVVFGRSRRALSLTRPPGHHATPTKSMGFCLFNNIAIAAHRARDEHGLSRILIVDWDVHHGNGTQDIFERDGGVAFLSIHRFGHGFYPGSGARDETGSGPGHGKIRNVPLAFGLSRDEYLAAFRNEVESFADAVKPELVLLSAGFDAHREDPVGSLGLEAEDFIDMTRILLDVANVHCKDRFVSVLEGGYNVDRLAECVGLHLDVLLTDRD